MDEQEGEEDDKQRADVVELADRIEALLYDEESEDEERKEGGKDETGDEGELKSILMAIDLSWERIGLMERRGFKVVVSVFITGR